MDILCDRPNLNTVMMEVCMCSSRGDGMDLDFLAALEASKVTKADEDFKRVLDASVEDAGAVSTAEETPLQQQQQAVKVCTIPLIMLYQLHQREDPGESPPVCRPANGSLCQGHNLQVQEWTRSAASRV
jgi:hypothetical protein